MSISLDSYVWYLELIANDNIINLYEGSSLQIGINQILTGITIYYKYDSKKQNKI